MVKSEILIACWMIRKMSSSEERTRRRILLRILIEDAIIAPVYFSVENHYKNEDIKE